MCECSGAKHTLCDTTAAMVVQSVMAAGGDSIRGDETLDAIRGGEVLVKHARVR